MNQIIVLDSEEKVLALEQCDQVKLPESERIFTAVLDFQGKIYFNGGKKDWRYGSTDPNGNGNTIYIRKGKEGNTYALWQSRKEFWEALKTGDYHIDDKAIR